MNQTLTNDYKYISMIKIEDKPKTSVFAVESKHKGKVATGEYVACYDGGFGNDRTRKKYDRINFTKEQQQQALGVTWTKKNITECIPPSYSKYIGDYFDK